MAGQFVLGKRADGGYDVILVSGRKAVVHPSSVGAGWEVFFGKGQSDKRFATLNGAAFWAARQLEPDGVVEK